MKEDISTRYEWAKVRFENGKLTREQWLEICTELLLELMEKNKDVLIRLKDR